MPQGISEIETIYLVSTFILIIIISGVIALIYQYRKRKIEYVVDKKNTEMKHHTELQEATLEMQQLTMQDIGREIHDGVGQRLTLASIYTKQLLSKDIPLEVKAKAEEINIILNDSLGQLRTLSKELTNEKNHDIDLEKLIAVECKKMENLQICQINYSQNGDVFISNKKAMFIVRILQEFLQNSLKYADCRMINIKLIKTNKTLSIFLSDDGKGFNIQFVSKGIGLQNMKRRAEMINATIDIQSELTKGTSLQLELNLH